MTVSTDLVTDAAAALSRPRREPADSFRLHAPLELAARARLLDRLGGHDPTAAAGIEQLVARYDASGTPLGERPEVEFASPDDAARALAAGIDAGDVDRAGDAARWLGGGVLGGRVSAPTLVALVAPVALRRLTAAGHANIFFQLLDSQPHRLELGTLLHPLARELARDPSACIRPLGSAASSSLEALAGGLGRVGPAEDPQASFIRPLVDRAQDDPDTAALLHRLARPADAARARRYLLETAQWSMLAEPPDFVAYGWTHGLTLPLAALEVGRLTGAPGDAWEVALTYVVAHRLSLGQRPLAPPDLSAGAPTAAELAHRAAAHPDAHVVKYTVACLDLADRDPDLSVLHRAAADRLLRHWDA